MGRRRPTVRGLSSGPRRDRSALGRCGRGRQRPCPLLPPLVAFGIDQQQSEWLPAMLGGQTIGAYSLSEPHAGSDAAALNCKAAPVDGGYRVNGTKSWITHGGIADFYTLFARTGTGSQGVSCFLVPKETPGLTFGKPEEKMGLHAVPTTSAHYDDAFIPIFS